MTVRFDGIVECVKPYPKNSGHRSRIRQSHQTGQSSVILYGNLAPEGASRKSRAKRDCHLPVCARFDGEEKALQAILDGVVRGRRRRGDSLRRSKRWTGNARNAESTSAMRVVDSPASGIDYGRQILGRQSRFRRRSHLAGSGGWRTIGLVEDAIKSPSTPRRGKSGSPSPTPRSPGRKSWKARALHASRRARQIRAQRQQRFTRRRDRAE